MSEIIIISTDLIDTNSRNAMYSSATADDLLVASIREHGILSPLTVIPNGKRWILESGHRRFDGAKKAGRDVVPCIVAEPQDEAEAAMRHVFHNLQRAKTEGDIYGELLVLSKTLTDRPDLAERYGLSDAKDGQNSDFGGQPPKSKKRVLFGQLAAAWNLTRNRVEMLWIVYDNGVRDEWIETLPAATKKKRDEAVKIATQAWDYVRDQVDAGELSLKRAYEEIAEIKQVAIGALAKTKAQPKAKPEPKLKADATKPAKPTVLDDDLGWMLPVMDGGGFTDEEDLYESQAVTDTVTGQFIKPKLAYSGGRPYLVLVVSNADDVEGRRYAMDWDMLAQFQPA